MMVLMAKHVRSPKGTQVLGAGHSTLQPLLISTTVTATTFLDDCPGHVLWLMLTLGERSPQTPKQTLTMFKADGASPSLFPLPSLCGVEHTLCTSYVWDCKSPRNVYCKAVEKRT